MFKKQMKYLPTLVLTRSRFKGLKTDQFSLSLSISTPDIDHFNLNSKTFQELLWFLWKKKGNRFIMEM